MIAYAEVRGSGEPSSLNRFLLISCSPVFVVRFLCAVVRRGLAQAQLPPAAAYVDRPVAVSGDRDRRPRVDRPRAAGSDPDADRRAAEDGRRARDDHALVQPRPLRGRAGRGRGRARRRRVAALCPVADPHRDQGRVPRRARAVGGDAARPDDRAVRRDAAAGARAPMSRPRSRSSTTSADTCERVGEGRAADHRARSGSRHAGLRRDAGTAHDDCALDGHRPSARAGRRDPVAAARSGRASPTSPASCARASPTTSPSMRQPALLRSVGDRAAAGVQRGPHARRRDRRRPAGAARHDRSSPATRCPRTRSPSSSRSSGKARSTRICSRTRRGASPTT